MVSAFIQYTKYTSTVPEIVIWYRIIIIIIIIRYYWSGGEDIQMFKILEISKYLVLEISLLKVDICI